jgi:hypothetical protein
MNRKSAQDCALAADQHQQFLRLSASAKRCRSSPNSRQDRAPWTSQFAGFAGSSPATAEPDLLTLSASTPSSGRTSLRRRWSGRPTSTADEFDEVRGVVELPPHGKQVGKSHLGSRPASLIGSLAAVAKARGAKGCLSDIGWHWLTPSV